MEQIIKGVFLSNLKQIQNPKGDIYHAIKSSDESFKGFGEAYFSMVNTNEIKAWKKHSLMSCNLIVPYGEVKFVLYDSRETSESFGKFFEVIIGPKNYLRLSIPPEIIFGFKGLGDHNIVLNVSDILHSPEESQNFDLNFLEFSQW